MGGLAEGPVMPRGPCGEKRPADVIDRVGRLLVALLLAVLVAAAIIAQIPPLGPIEGYGVAFCMALFAAGTTLLLLK